MAGHRTLEIPIKSGPAVKQMTVSDWLVGELWPNLTPQELVNEIYGLLETRLRERVISTLGSDLADTTLAEHVKEAE